MGSDRIPECVVQVDELQRKAAAEIGTGLMQIAEVLTPIYDMAEGQRAHLIARGWSAEAAESAASTLLNEMIRSTMRPAGARAA